MPARLGFVGRTLIVDVLGYEATADRFQAIQALEIRVRNKHQWIVENFYIESNLLRPEVGDRFVKSH